MAKVSDGASDGVNWTVKIEMNVPLSRIALLKKKMQDCIAFPFLVKAASRVFMIRESAREISAAPQS
jgi:hypothetical protein